MRGYRPVMENTPLKAAEGFSGPVDRPFVLTLGITFYVCTILLALSLGVQSGLAFLDIDGSDYELIKHYINLGGFLVYALLLLYTAVAPFYSIITKKPRHYTMYQAPYGHIACALYVALLACPDILFDDDDMNQIYCSFWVISIILIGLYTAWCVIAFVNRRKIKAWTTGSA